MENIEIHYVYRHRRLDTNEIFYVGLGTIRKRDTKSKSNYVKYERAYSKDRTLWWKNVVSKSDYNVEVIFKSASYDDMKELEMFLISLYGRRDLGKGTLVNLTDGGEGAVGVIISENTREKLRNSYKASGATHRDSKPVINYKTLERYESVAEASKKCNIPSTTLHKRLKGETTNTTSLCYLEDYLKGNVDFSDKVKKTTGKRVKNIITGEEFSSIIEASKSIGMLAPTLTAQLAGKVSNRSNFILV